MNGLNIAVDYAKDKYNNRYYILILNYSERRMNIKSFKNINIATKVYSQLENEIDANIVLVSASSLDTLRIAYPNYFVDISQFVKMMRKFLT